MKKVIILLTILATLILGFAGYLIVKDLKSTKADSSSEGPSTAKLDDIREFAGGSITEEEMQSFKEQGLNPFGQTTTQEELTDIHFQEYIHGMSHQKVKAPEKWGFYQINSERIDWLLEGLDKSELISRNLYREILEKWANGDFSSADDDHNAIWELQGGTIGKATGVLSSEEEKVYIESQK
jgi:hypothetical protein